MSSPNQGKKDQSTQSGKGVDSGKILNYFGIVGGIITIIGVIAGVINNVIVPITKHTEAISDIRASLEDIDEDMQDLSKDVRELSEAVYINNGKNSVLSANNTENKTRKLKFVKDYLPQVEMVNNEPELKETKWIKTVFIAEDAEENKYKPPDLYNETFMTSYTENGKEVYFLGQYNENNHWNGKCILNVYNEGKLESIFEAIYNDGELYSYKRISDEKDETWKITDRINKEDYKTGETWVYSKAESYKQEISLENYDESQILDFENFTEYKDQQLLSYYNGRTADSCYNDSTGDAYLVTYFKRGEISAAGDKDVIKTLYKGNFLDGIFNDDSDEAWYITREVDTTYMYYEGSFSGGTADNIKVEEFENYIGRNYISNKLHEKGFQEYEADFFVEY